MQLLHLFTAVVLIALSCFALGYTFEKTKRFSTAVNILVAVVSVITFSFMMKISLALILLSLH